MQVATHQAGQYETILAAVSVAAGTVEADNVNKIRVLVTNMEWETVFELLLKLENSAPGAFSGGIRRARLCAAALLLEQLGEAMFKLTKASKLLNDVSACDPSGCRAILQQEVGRLSSAFKDNESDRFSADLHDIRNSFAGEGDYQNQEVSKALSLHTLFGRPGRMQIQLGNVSKEELQLLIRIVEMYSSVLEGTEERTEELRRTWSALRALILSSTYPDGTNPTLNFEDLSKTDELRGLVELSVVLQEGALNFGKVEERMDSIRDNLLQGQFTFDGEDFDLSTEMEIDLETAAGLIVERLQDPEIAELAMEVLAPWAGMRDTMRYVAHLRAELPSLAALDGLLHDLKPSEQPTVQVLLQTLPRAAQRRRKRDPDPVKTWYHGCLHSFTQEETENLSNLMKIRPNDEMLSEEEYKRQYRMLMMGVHPDKDKSPGASERTQTINALNDKIMKRCFPSSED